MTMELYFVCGLLAFALTKVLIGLEHFVATHWLHKHSLFRKKLRNFEKKHPHLCDNQDVFYCFFKRDSFH